MRTIQLKTKSGDVTAHHNSDWSGVVEVIWVDNRLVKSIELPAEVFTEVSMAAVSLVKNKIIETLEDL